MGFLSHSWTLLLFLLVPAALLAVGGFILGWAFRKGWDRAAPKGPQDHSA